MRLFLLLAPALVLALPSARADEPLRVNENADLPSAPPDLEESYVRMKRTGGLSPFRLIEDAVVLRGSTPMANHSKEVVNQEEHDNRMALLTLTEYRALLDALEARDILVLRDTESAPGRADVPTFEIEYQRNGRRNAVRIHGLRYAGDPRYQAVVSLIIDAVRQKTGAIHFRNGFVDAAEAGWLNLESRPVARVIIDDLDTHERTPLFGWQLGRGAHTVRLVDDEKGIDRSFDFMIDAGMTTILNVDLR